MNKSTKILVGISLVVNALLIGVIVGNISSRSHHRHWGHHCHKSKHSKHGSTKFDKLFEKNRSMFKQVGAAREEVFKALTAEKFDPVVYEQKSKELHQVYAGIGASMTANIKETAMTLSQADRIELAEELRSFGRHRKEGHRKG